MTLIDNDILNDWHTCLSDWEVERWQQHPQHTLAMVRQTMSINKQKRPVRVPGCTLIYILAHQSQESMTRALDILAQCEEDSLVLVGVPATLHFYPKPSGND